MENNIKRIREAKGLTQRDLGLLLSIDTKTVYRHEKGIIKLTENTIAAYAKALNCAPSEIISSEWKPSTQEINVAILKEAVKQIINKKINNADPEKELDMKCELIALWYEEKVKESSNINKEVIALNNN